MLLYLKERTDSNRRGWRGITGKEGEGSSQGTCIKHTETKTQGVGRIERGSWGLGRTGESNGEIGTTN